MVIDWTTQLFNKRESNNNIRFITELLAGVGIATLGKAIQPIVLYIK